MRLRRRVRSGFTLMEVILATTIAVLILGALYVAVNMQLQCAQLSRDTIQDSTLERALTARMDADAAHVVGLSDPARYRFQAGLDTVQPASTTGAGGMNSASGTGANASTNTSNTATANTTSANSSTSSTSGATSSFGSTSAVTNSSGATNIVLPLGVMGDSQTLHLFVSNLPHEIYASSASFNNADAGNTPPVSDIRRISYWLIGDSDNPGGLARQEISVATSDDALQNLPPQVDNETSFIIADEVRSVQFQYWDGTDWQDSWDSTELGPDGVTPIGSPLAVAVTVGVARKRSDPDQADAPLRTFRHVLVIPSANGMTLQTEAASGTSTATPSSTTNSSSTTTGGGASP